MEKSAKEQHANQLTWTQAQEPIREGGKEVCKDGVKQTRPKNMFEPKELEQHLAKCAINHFNQPVETDFGKQNQCNWTILTGQASLGMQC